MLYTCFNGIVTDVVEGEEFSSDDDEFENELLEAQENGDFFCFHLLQSIHHNSLKRFVH